MSVFSIASLVVSVVSTVYSFARQRSAARKAKAAQDKAKENARGTHIAVEGEVLNLPIAYGRCKVSGARVFHEVTSNYIGAQNHVEGCWVFAYGGSIIGTRVDGVACSSLSVGLYQELAFMPDDGVGSWQEGYRPVLSGGSPVYTATDPRPLVTTILGSRREGPYTPVSIPATVTSGFINFDSATGKFNTVVTAGLPHIFLVSAKVTTRHKNWFMDAQGVYADIEGTHNYTVDSYNSVSGALVLNSTDTSNVVVRSNGYEQNRPLPHSASVSGKKVNQALWFQQAICVGGIESVKHMEIDDEDYRLPKHSLRSHVRPNGGAEPWFVTNFPNMVTSQFPGICHATTLIWLDRDDPQFGAAPNVTYHVEGMRVRRVIKTGSVYTLSVDRTYSNSPALVLLDYLLWPELGKGLPEAEVDLKSFYEADLICKRKVPINGRFIAPYQGYLWIEKSRDNQPHYVNLYECNLALDTAATVRDNIDLILSTMENSDLVWSNGVYSLLLHYPEEYTATFTETSLGKLNGAEPLIGHPSYYNTGEVVQFPAGATSNIDLYRSTVDNNLLPPLTSGVINTGWERGPATGLVCAYITDDDITSEGTISQAWTSTQERLNFCTVRFLNEAKNFEEDTVSWPNKYPQTILKGTGAIIYPASANWDNATDIGNLLNAYGVWHASGAFSWKFHASETGTYTMSGVSTHGAVVTMQATSLTVGTEVGAMVVSLVKDTQYTITIASSAGAAPRAVSFKLAGPTGGLVWTTRDVSYSSIVGEVKSNAVYSEYLAEDSGVFLESEFFQAGDTSEYHAMNTAENKVRMSRAAVEYSFTLTRKFFRIEPGDFVKLTSELLGIPGELLRVRDVKVTSSGSIEIMAEKFDARNLSWNAKDTEIVKPRNIYSPVSKQATNLVFTPAVSYEDHSGVLSWDLAGDSTVNSYSVYGTVVPLAGLNIDTSLDLIGNTSTGSLLIPTLPRGSYTFVVASVNDRGVESKIIEPIFGLNAPAISAIIENTTVLPAPTGIRIFCTPDSAGHISKLRVIAEFGQVEPTPITGLVIFISQFPVDNQVLLASGGTTGSLTIGSAAVLASGTATILSGSTTNKLVARDIGTPFDVTYNECSRWWCKVAGSEWRKVTGITDTAVLFERGFAEADDTPVVPVIGQPFEYAELAWFDERVGEYRLGIVDHGGSTEVIRWHTVEQDSPASPFVIKCTRGAEGTTPTSIDGKYMKYLPAPGAGTQNILFPAESFRFNGAGWEATTDISVSISAGYTVYASAAIAHELPDKTILRSVIVPCLYGGPL